MGLVELLLGVVFVTGVAIGIGIGAMGDAGPYEFWAARGGFIVAAAALAGAFYYWLQEHERSNAAIVIFGTLVGLWAFVGLPFQLKWIDARETKLRRLEATSTPQTDGNQSRSSLPAQTAGVAPS